MCTIHRAVKHGKAFDRREFVKMAAGTGVAVAATTLLGDEFVQAQDVAKTAPGADAGVRLLQAACPYCGVAAA